MRNPLAPLAAASMLALASCQTAGLSGADIVNDLGLACQSAQQILALPSVAAPASTKVQISAAKLSTKVAAYCSAAQIAAPAVTSILDDLNTQAAVLLGTGVAKP